MKWELAVIAMTGCSFLAVFYRWSYRLGFRRGMDVTFRILESGFASTSTGNSDDHGEGSKGTQG